MAKSLTNDQRRTTDDRSASYETAVARMYALGHELAHTPSHKFDLAHMRTLLGALDHPERRFPSVLIAGTNGKGSTAATLGINPAGFGIAHGAIHVAPPGAHQ